MLRKVLSGSGTQRHRGTAMSARLRYLKMSSDGIHLVETLALVVRFPLHAFTTQNITLISPLRYHIHFSHNIVFPDSIRVCGITLNEKVVIPDRGQGLLSRKQGK